MEVLNRQRIFSIGKWLALLALVLSPWSRAAEAVAREYQVKAVFLWRLAQFAEWPTNSFEHANSPIVIGVLGQNPFGDALEVALRGETAHGRPLKVEPLASETAASGCHLVFISKSEAPRLRQTMARLRDKSIVTVSDIETGFLENGGMIQFRTQDNKVRMTINTEAATAARIVIDARLLRIADVVRKPAP
jgi:hypothetical protein